MSSPPSSPTPGPIKTTSTARHEKRQRMREALAVNLGESPARPFTVSQELRKLSSEINQEFSDLETKQSAIRTASKELLPVREGKAEEFTKQREHVAKAGVTAFKKAKKILQDLRNEGTIDRSTFRRLNNELEKGEDALALERGALARHRARIALAITANQFHERLGQAYMMAIIQKMTLPAGTTTELRGKRESSDQTDFRQKLIRTYNGPEAIESDALWCPVLKVYLYNSPLIMTAAHIVPHCIGESNMAYLLGVPLTEGFSALWSEKNGLLLHSRIEQAYDQAQLTIIPRRDDSSILTVVLLDQSIANQVVDKIGTSLLRFSDLGDLEFKTDARPGRRNLYINTLFTVFRRKRYNVPGHELDFDKLSMDDNAVWASPGNWMRRSILQCIAAEIGDVFTSDMMKRIIGLDDFPGQESAEQEDERAIELRHGLEYGAPNEDDVSLLEEDKWWESLDREEKRRERLHDEKLERRWQGEEIPNQSRIFKLQKPLQFDSNPNSKDWDLGGFLYAIRGYFSACKVATGRLVVNVNVTHGTFYKELSLLEILRLDALGPDEKWHRVPKPVTLIGLASPKYSQSNLPNRPKIDRYGANADEVKFWFDSNSTSTQGEYISVTTFFRRIGHPLKSVDFVVVYGSEQRPMFLPSEVCRTMPGNPYRLQLSPEKMARMMNFSVRKPQANAYSIVNEGLRMVGLSGEPTKLQSINVPAIPRLITVNARVLQPPMLEYQRKQRVMHGSWDLRDCRFHTPIKVHAFGVLVIHEAALPSFKTVAHAKGPIQNVQLAMDMCGMSPGPFRPNTDLHRVSLDKDFDSNAKAHLQNLKKLGKKFALVVVPRKYHPVYSTVKRLADQEIGIHTVCVAFETLTTQNWKQTLCNVALKVNLKLGGVNHLTVFDNSVLDDGKTMLLSYDVTHPSPCSSGAAPSIVGMVASVDKRLAQWPGTLEAQEARKEETTGLTAMFERHLQLWKAKGGNAEYPENIIVYRDGVGDRQYDMVRENELPLMRRACAALYAPKKQPRLTIIVVGKRHHTRFYPTSTRDADRSTNPKAGTVVDRGVTLHREFDFFLQAHAAIKGTARPAHYSVLLDEVFSAHFRGKGANVADEIQKFTMALSHTFGRATKAISVCTPARYTDILCDRGRRYYQSLYGWSVDNASTSSVGPPLGPIHIAPELRDDMFYL